jgi:hypothetical protein
MPAMFLNFLDLHFLSITPFWYTIVAHTQLLLAFHGVWPSVDQYELSATIILNSLSIALFHNLLAISISSMDLSVIFYIVGSLLVTSMFFVLKNGMYS